jgi:hypothetical protein
MPTLELASGKTAPCDAQNMRNLPIQVPAHEQMAEGMWTILYERKHYNQANSVLEALQSASVKLGIQV